MIYGCRENSISLNGLSGKVIKYGTADIPIQDVICEIEQP